MKLHQREHCELRATATGGVDGDDDVVVCKLGVAMDIFRHSWVDAFHEGLHVGGRERPRGSVRGDTHALAQTDNAKGRGRGVTPCKGMYG